ncbi:hypothetical protein WR25_09217 [Diploscapter pachys]|uniref:Uncharacterized protein n=1 Tax=Diploscapter pachys TaxID=2018661 RepID=A0A2A2KU15_9BILA|nr:hypothetical protein WR25_09217 [Diploscapter pachys]
MIKKKEQDEEKKRLAAEKKKQQEEEQKLKKQQEEERKQKEKEEAERKKQEEKERKQREKEEAELKKKQQEEEERIRKEQEETERKKQEEEEQRRQAELEKMREAELNKEIYIPVAAEPQSVEEPIDVVTIESHAKKEPSPAPSNNSKKAGEKGKSPGADSGKESAEAAGGRSGKKNKKGKAEPVQSKDEITPEMMEAVDEAILKPGFVNEQAADLLEQNAPQQGKKNKKDRKEKRKSESERKEAAAPKESEISMEQTQPADDGLDFLDFVTKKENRSVESAPVPTEQQVQQSEQQSTETIPSNDDSLDFLDFVTKKEDRSNDNIPASTEEPLQQSEQQPIETIPSNNDSLDFLDFVTPKADKQVEENVPQPTQPSDVSELDYPVSTIEQTSEPIISEEERIADAIGASLLEQEKVQEQEAETPKESGKKNKKDRKDKKKSESENMKAETGYHGDKESTPEAVGGGGKSKRDKKDKKKRISESTDKPAEQLETVQNIGLPESAPIPTADDSMDFLDFVTPRAAKEEEPPAAIPTEVLQNVQSDVSAIGADDLDFLNFVTPKSASNQAADAASHEIPQDVQEPAVQQPTTEAAEDDLDFLNFVTPKAEKDETPSVVVSSEPPPILDITEPQPTQPVKPTSDDLDFLDFVTPKNDEVSSFAQIDVDVKSGAVGEQAVEQGVQQSSESQGEHGKSNKKKDKKHRKSESEQQNLAPQEISKSDISKESTPEQHGSKKNKNKNKGEKRKSESESQNEQANLPAADQSPELKQIETLELSTEQQSEPQPSPAEDSKGSGKKNKKNKRKSESEQTPKEVTPEKAAVLETAQSVTESAPVGDKKEHESGSKKNKKNKGDKRKSESEDVRSSSKSEGCHICEDSDRKNMFGAGEPEAKDCPLCEDTKMKKGRTSKSPSSKSPKKGSTPEPKHGRGDHKESEGSSKKSKKQKRKSESEKSPLSPAQDDLADQAMEAFLSGSAPNVDADEFMQPVTAPVESDQQQKSGKNKKDKKNKGKDGKQQQTDNAPQVAQEEEVVITRTGELGQEKPNQKEQKSPSTDDVPPQTEMTNGKGKKDKKRKHDSGNDKTSAPVTTSHEKSNGHAVNLEQIELDYYDGKSGHDHSGDNNNQGGGKKKDKKGKNKGGRVNSTSEDTTVISEVRVSKDEMEVDKEIAAITGQPGQISPPIQVHEVSSTAEDDHANGTTVTTEVITASIPVDSKELTEDLIKQYASQALRASDCKLIESDPSVKLKIDAQLVKLAERKPVVIMETKQYIKPLPLELQTSRPSTPINKERMYKLLPKDIIFCSNLIDNHGENFNEMANDPLNIYKESARGLQRKIRESPHYQTYLRAKEEGKPIEEMVVQLEGH